MTPELATQWKVFFGGSPVAAFLVVSLAANMAQWFAGRKDRSKAEERLALSNEAHLRTAESITGASKDLAQAVVVIMGTPAARRRQHEPPKALEVAK